MLTYNDLYETVRKEKYAEILQQLPKDFISEVATFLHEQKGNASLDEVSFLDSAGKSKKQLENSIALFKELMLRRKKKVLSLVFVATETGIMKRDYENMLSFEKGIFDKLLKTFEEGDKELAHLLHGTKETTTTTQQTMIIFNQDTEQFVDMTGNAVGPFSNGELAHLDSNISSILVSSGKATYVDEK